MFIAALCANKGYILNTSLLSMSGMIPFVKIKW